MNVLRIPGLSARGQAQGARGWRARARARHDADAWLRASAGRFDNHPAYAWRTAQLTSPRERRLLARSLHAVVQDVRKPRGLSPSPINRRGLAPQADAIEELSQRLADLERPVTAAGILLVHDLLTNGGSPLYLHGRVADLRKTLSRIRTTLEAL